MRFIYRRMIQMIDRIIGYDQWFHSEIWLSDKYPNEEFIGYENKDGEVIFYD